MFDRWTERAREAREAAVREAASDGGAFVEPHHLLIGVLLVHPALAREISPSLTIENACRFLKRQPNPPVSPHNIPLSHTSKHVLAYAGQEVTRARPESRIETIHILIGLLRESDSRAAAFLRSIPLDPEKLRMRRAAL
jgi:ATP-dependent Clp protease ATP-binding subunit ClpA